MVAVCCVHAVAIEPVKKAVQDQKARQRQFRRTEDAPRVQRQDMSSHLDATGHNNGSFHVFSCLFRLFNKCSSMFIIVHLSLWMFVDGFDFFALYLHLVSLFVVLSLHIYVFACFCLFTCLFLWPDQKDDEGPDALYIMLWFNHSVLQVQGLLVVEHFIKACLRCRDVFLNCFEI